MDVRFKQEHVHGKFRSTISQIICNAARAARTSRIGSSYLSNLMAPTMSFVIFDGNSGLI